MLHIILDFACSSGSPALLREMEESIETRMGGKITHRTLVTTDTVHLDAYKSYTRIQGHMKVREYLRKKVMVPSGIDTRIAVSAILSAEAGRSIAVISEDQNLTPLISVLRRRFPHLRTGLFSFSGAEFACSDMNIAPSATPTMKGRTCGVVVDATYFQKTARSLAKGASLDIVKFDKYLQEISGVSAISARWWIQAWENDTGFHRMLRNNTQGTKYHVLLCKSEAKTFGTLNVPRVEVGADVLFVCMLLEAASKYDCVIGITGDQDMLPGFQAVKERYGKQVICLCSRATCSKKLAGFDQHLLEDVLPHCLTADLSRHQTAPHYKKCTNPPCPQQADCPLLKVYQYRRRDPQLEKHMLEYTHPCPAKECKCSADENRWHFVRFTHTRTPSNESPLRKRKRPL